MVLTVWYFMYFIWFN